ncbi:Conserved oligomeric Golgi complex subunit 6 [Gracilariopsis chorda]|uniref:Conserved oligomeric Golgi complex subunit 6 n=1 Tax=Gracilariopsis chorda TaxID=448386 RepID=A0A2V3IQK2_9FLOR|nr:Conserved oligomeric Golgi complex subunit 6 [Gracilariopsis chorda]|eukprot:PXF44376.1 Conserved oligomeric Golgi complex subunit 6 [Gracilariopsis chorda]
MTTASDDTTQAPTSWAVLKMRSLLDAPIPAESPSLLAAIRQIQTFYTTNSPATRRDLAPTLARRAVDSTKSVLDAFSDTHKQLQDVQKHIADMQKDVQALTKRLSGARSDASTVVSQTSQLRAKLSDAQYRAAVSTAFLNRFVLQGELAAALQSEEVNATFLQALHKLEQIDHDSRFLLRSRNQRAGLEALEFAATKKEEAYEKVFRFVQARCGTLDVDAEENEQEAALLREAIRALRARPMLLRYCAEGVGSARRASLVTRFVGALTEGGPGGMPRPIEMHAHDAMRYTNDMLAWMHQALASEKELINRLFTLEANTGDDTTRAHNEELALKVLNTVFDALCRPFRIRFEQALEQTLPVVVLYRLASLLEFYATTMSHLLGKDAALPEMLMECRSIAMYGFFSAWKSKMESFRLSGVGPSEDLVPPAAVNQSMTRLDEIMVTLDASLVPEDARHDQIAAVLEVILNPLQSLCESMASRNLSPVERQVFMANCIDSMRMPLMAYSFASSRVEQLTSIADNHIDNYIQLGTVIVLRRCGLAERARILAEAKQTAALTSSQGTETSKRKPLSRIPGMDVEALSISVKNFYALLFSGSTVGSSEVLKPPHVNKITNVRWRNRARAAVAESLAATHTEIFKALQDSTNEYGEDAIATVGMRDPEKVKLILTNGGGNSK